MERSLTDLIGNLVVEGQKRPHQFADHLYYSPNELKIAVSQASEATLAETLPITSKAPGWTGWGVLILAEWLTLSPDEDKPSDLISAWMRVHAQYPWLQRSMFHSHWDLPMPWGEGHVTTHGLWALASMTQDTEHLTVAYAGGRRPRSGPITDMHLMADDLHALMATAHTLLTDGLTPPSWRTHLAQTMATLLLDHPKLGGDIDLTKRWEILVQAWESQPTDARFNQITQWCQLIYPTALNDSLDLIPRFKLKNPARRRWLNRWGREVCEAHEEGVIASPSSVETHMQILRGSVMRAIEVHGDTGNATKSLTDQVALPVLQALRAWQPELVDPQTWRDTYASVPLGAEVDVVSKMDSWIGEVTALRRADKVSFVEPENTKPERQRARP